MRLDFVGIGTGRSATNWIFQCLKEHSQICGSKKGETGLFNCFKKEVYDCNFSHCKENQIKGEFTPTYITDPEALLAIKKHFPRIKIIVCLRNPIERVYAQFLGKKLVGKLNEKETFEKAVFGAMAFEGVENYFVKLGLYYSQLKTVFELFPGENILVLIYEDIAKDPVKFIQRIYEFLGVNPNFVPSMVNERVGQLSQNFRKSALLNKALIKTLCFFRKKPLKPVGAFLKKIKVNKLVNFIVLANYRAEKDLKPYIKPPIQEETRKALQEIYRPEIKNLEKLINRDLTFWQ